MMGRVGWSVFVNLRANCGETQSEWGIRTKRPVARPRPVGEYAKMLWIGCRDQNTDETLVGNEKNVRHAKLASAFEHTTWAFEGSLKRRVPDKSTQSV